MGSNINTVTVGEIANNNLTQIERLNNDLAALPINPSPAIRNSVVEPQGFLTVIRSPTREERVLQNNNSNSEQQTEERVSFIPQNPIQTSSLAENLRSLARTRDNPFLQNEGNAEEREVVRPRLITRESRDLNFYDMNQRSQNDPNKNSNVQRSNTIKDSVPEDLVKPFAKQTVQEMILSSATVIKHQPVNQDNEKKVSEFDLNKDTDIFQKM